MTPHQSWLGLMHWLCCHQWSKVPSAILNLWIKELGLQIAKRTPDSAPQKVMAFVLQVTTDVYGPRTAVSVYLVCHDKLLVVQEVDKGRRSSSAAQSQCFVKCGEKASFHDNYSALVRCVHAVLGTAWCAYWAQDLHMNYHCQLPVKDINYTLLWYWLIKQHISVG